MKHVALVSSRPGTSKRLLSDVAGVLGPGVTLIATSLEEGLPPMGEMDLVLVTGREFASEVVRQMPQSSNLLVTVRTLRRRDWEMLVALPARTRVLVVHEDQDSVSELTAIIFELGIRHIEMIPYYPGAQRPERIDLAITSGTPQHVPPEIHRVTNLGVRPVDAVTMLEVMTRLDLLDEAGNARLLRWMAETMPRSQGLRTAISWLAELRRQHEAVLDHVQDAVVACDAHHRVTFFNRQAELLFDQRAGAIVGRLASDVVPKLDLTGFLHSNESPVDRLIKVGRAEIMITYVALRDGDEVSGVVATLRPVRDIWTSEERLRREAAFAGHRARYTFEHIIGQSQTLKTVLQKAQRVAASGSAVLIRGQTGVGKEVLAQAIHNASARASHPFVALNCAALPETLLESELFGYEEGAFTGARRGGKPGLFEQAHRGTIFLDEIGDVSPALQARLLRVLELNEVLRVGGTKVIPVNIRVIAATNKDLDTAVALGAFRADLLYRLNVLPLDIPPLRDRRDDIPLIFWSILQGQGHHRDVAPEVLERLVSYDWPGNIRELRNCVEYMTTMSDGPIQLEDLPLHIGRINPSEPGKSVGPRPAGAPNAEPRWDRSPAQPELRMTDDLGFLLTEVWRAQLRGTGIGRRALADRAAAAGWVLSESEVRQRLVRLEAAGLVHQKRGRGGTVLTHEGWNLAEMKPIAHPQTGENGS